MKKNQIQRHPNQENKTGKAIYASTTAVNSSTVSELSDAKAMPEGAETNFKDKMLNKKKEKERNLSKAQKK
jgi:hypothetical protein